MDKSKKQNPKEKIEVGSEYTHEQITALEKLPFYIDQGQDVKIGKEAMYLMYGEEVIATFLVVGFVKFEKLLRCVYISPLMRV